MKMDWNQFVGKTINITLFENYGVVYSRENSEQPAFYEIVFKTGTLLNAFDEGLMLESVRDNNLKYKVFVPYNVIKCVEVFD